MPGLDRHRHRVAIEARSRGSDACCGRSPARRRPSARTASCRRRAAAAARRSSRQTSNAARTSSSARGHQHADRLDLVDRRVGRVAAARGAIEQHVAFDGAARGAPRARRLPRGWNTTGCGRGACIGRGSLRDASPGRRSAAGGRMAANVRIRMLLDFAGPTRRERNARRRREAPPRLHHARARHRTRPAAISCRFPGPTNVPDRVLRAIDQPTIDHRGPEFAELTLRDPRRPEGRLPDRRAGRSSTRRPAPAHGKRRSSTRCRPAIAC